MIYERQPFAAELVMDLARYHHDQVEFYREEVNRAADGATGDIYTRLVVHKKVAEDLRALARHLDGVREDPPARVVGGRSMRSNECGIPWERP